MERTARFHAFFNNVSLFTNIRKHLIWNDKFHTAHVHRCDIALIEADHHFSILVEVKGSVIGYGLKVPFSAASG